MDVQREADIGQQIAETEWDVAKCAWNHYDKECAAINRDFQSRKVTVENRTELELEWSLARLAVEEPSMPRPGQRPGSPRNLRAVPADHTGPRPFWGE